MSGRPWLEAPKATMREQGADADKSPEKTLEALPPERCERCKRLADAPTPSDDLRTIPKVHGSWGEEERRLMDAGWKPKERGGRLILANSETGFYCSQKVALHRIEAREVASVRTFSTQKSARHGLWERRFGRKERMPLNFRDSCTPMCERHGLWTGARCRDGSRCNAPAVWDKRLDRPLNGRCQMRGGLSAGPKTEVGRWRIAESNRAKSARPEQKRGIGDTVTQQGNVP
jgi:hypothetical protein